MADYDINFLIERVYQSININKEKNVNISAIVENKDRKTYITNFIDICKSLNRSEQDLLNYIAKETCQMTSIKEGGTLKIDSNIDSNVVKKIVEKYINTKVKCTSCGSKKTMLSTEQRITYLSCTVCNCILAVEK